MIATILVHPVIFAICVVAFVAVCAAASIVVELANMRRPVHGYSIRKLRAARPER
jgi:hypothetical protein